MNGTAALVDRGALVRRVESAATRRAARSLGVPNVVVGSGFWVVLAVVAVTVPLIVDRAGHQMDVGILATGGYSARWFAFALGLIMCATITATHVAAGGTRRALFRGALLATAGGGVFYGLAYTLAQLGERRLFDELGWPWQAPDFLIFGGQAGDLLLTLVGATLTIAVYILVGVAVAVGYLHHGAWRGTLLLVPNAALLAVAEVAGRVASWTDDVGLGLGRASAVVVTLLALAVAVALAAGWLRAMLFRLPIRPSR
ncbi:hypothetical protein [Isoptericola haloaureus]|uniref:Uncharacterized protein n=1 Tax=Isoptericola haloaureus TaxID=1542902 RepID=A0ABU7Z5C2_9MICO